ncbi:MAG TPA: hypothetical protein VHZ03_14030 [Trebonia sp.]|jgi:hypothetical protein|nr:hypothetical protein [Trebonia sp.]
MTGQLDLDDAAVDSRRASLDQLVVYKDRRVQPTADEILEYGLRTLLLGLEAQLEREREDRDG